MAVTTIKAKNAVESLRDVVQDLLVPELRAIKVEIDGMRSSLENSRIETRSNIDNLRDEMRSSNEAIRSEMKTSNEAVRTEMRLLHEQQKQATDNLASKLDYEIEIRERLAVLEDRDKRS